MPQRFFEKRRACRVSFDEEANFALQRTRDSRCSHSGR